jgi:hypothetical protein
VVTCVWRVVAIPLQEPDPDVDGGQAAGLRLRLGRGVRCRTARVQAGDDEPMSQSRWRPHGWGGKEVSTMRKAQMPVSIGPRMRVTTMMFARLCQAGGEDVALGRGHVLPLVTKMSPYYDR